MLTSIFKAWNNNHGIQLLFIGTAVGLLMCLLWWKQWLPEIRFNQLSTVNRIQVPAAGTKGLFVARIQTARSTPADIGGLLIFNPFAENPSDIPAEIIPFQLDLEGTATIVVELEPNKYAAVAYLDENRNGRFDLDESGKALEPFCTSSLTAPRDDWRELKEAAFTVTTPTTTYRLMEFKN